MIINKALRTPNFNKGESLTTYLLKVSKNNRVDICDLYRIITNDDLIKKRNKILFHRLDLYPKKVIDIRNLCTLLGLSENEIEDMTFTSVLKKLTEETTEKYAYEYAYKKLLPLINVKSRKFCPVCLKENGCFNIIWQVKELDICDKHLSYLRDDCQQCGCVQPYIHENMGSLKCISCSSPLTITSNSIIEHQIVSEQTLKYRDWNFLLNPLKSFPKVEGLTREQSLALYALYIAQNFEPKFSLQKVNGMKISYAKKLRSLVKGISQNVFNLTILLDLIRRHAMSVEEFSNLRVDDNFLKSFNPPKREIACLAPWCSSYGTSKNLIDKKRMTSTYKNLFVCTDCYIKYGTRKSTDKWEDVRGFIKIISDIKENLSPNTIPETQLSIEIGIDMQKCKQALGYMAYRKLLPSHWSDRYVPTMPENTLSLIEKFQNLITKSVKKMLKHSKKEYGWSSNDYYYYLAYPEVEHLLVFKVQDTFVRKIYNQGDLKEQVLEEIRSSNKEGTNISLKAISKRIGVGRTTLTNYGLDVLIASERYKQKFEIKIIKTKLVTEFISSKALKQERFKIIELYNFIQERETRLKKGYPSISQWITKAINESGLSK